MDKISVNMRSDVMRRIKSKETSLEKLFRKVLWANGIRYAKNNSSFFGKPDLMMKGKKIVIFIDSCFWHGCKKHCRMPNSNKSYWKNKIKRNKNRDKEVSNYYKEHAWSIVRIWEHQLKTERSINQQLTIIRNIRTKNTI